jgi:hypothetical protein
MMHVDTTWLIFELGFFAYFDLFSILVTTLGSGASEPGGREEVVEEGPD